MRPALASHRVSWFSLLREEREVVAAAHKRLEEMRSRINPGETYDFDMLGALYIEKSRLTFKWAKEGSLQAWLYLHAPLTAAALTALALHVYSVWYY